MVPEKLLKEIRFNFKAVIARRSNLGKSLWRELLDLHPVDIAQFLSDNKLGDSAFTNAEYLTSLQIPSYYYQDLNSDLPTIQPYEGLVLKRFIPYSQFSPPEFNKGEKIPTKTPTKTYINYNYCQFIPFGIENVYNKKIDSSNLSSF